MPHLSRELHLPFRLGVHHQFNPLESPLPADVAFANLPDAPADGLLVRADGNTAVPESAAEVTVPKSRADTTLTAADGGANLRSDNATSEVY